MKANKSIIGCTLIAAAMAPAYADLTFVAPGMDSPYVTTNLSKDWSQNLGTYWKYIINGYEYHLYAGVPDGGKVKGNGQLSYKTGNAQFPGATSLTAKINGQTIVSKNQTAHNINDSTGRIIHNFSSPIILTEQSITPSFTLSTNMIGAGDYITIIGSALEAPPTPIGTLIAPHYVRDGGRPTLQWFITKSLEGAGTTEEVVIPPETENESSNSGEGKSNNGHGNNVDGIDSSNPGKSAAKWAAKGYYDTDYDGDGVAEDDEGHGGGSAMSKTKNSNP
ncbi:hypothetical protein NT6N_35580 [Oceaniferula spumae]|uniref:DUF5666 domain-containing protein n=1 Tax=Oceaniferula spumae TaxID=2979115 RepID=A0AAT9FRE9_9BACT